MNRNAWIEVANRFPEFQKSLIKNSLTYNSKYMTNEDFFQLVDDMRKAQKEYFATKSKAALIRSKELEKKVDECIKYLNDPSFPMPKI